MSTINHQSNRGILMIIIGALILLILGAIVIIRFGLITNFACNSQILKRVQDTYLRPQFNETIINMSEGVLRTSSYVDSTVLTNINWSIRSRGQDGCLVTVNSEINGQPNEGPIYYVDLISETISPEDEWAKMVFILAEDVLNEDRLLPLGP